MSKKRVEPWVSAMQIEKKELGAAGVGQMAYLLDAANENRFAMINQREIAVKLFNQVGTLAGRRIDDFQTWLAVVSELNLTVEQIVAEYEITNTTVLDLSTEHIERLIEIAREHLAVAAAREEMNPDVPLGLDTTISIESHRGTHHFQFCEVFNNYCDGGQAWIMAFSSPLEAYAYMKKLRDYYRLPIDEIRNFIVWCRRAVGLPEDLVYKVDGETARLLSQGY